MTEPRTYPHGVPSWVDTVAHDLDEAKRFYAGLFDWTFTDAMPAEAPGNYLIATIGGEDVAAIGITGLRRRGRRVAHLRRRRRRRRHCRRPSRRRAAPSTLAPVDAGPGGRRRCASIRAAPSSDCGRRASDSARNWSTRPGSWNFSDLHTTDPHAAATFYSTLFGWEVDDVGYATMVRRPGYGDHLAATVDPDIRARQSDIAAPAGFEDAVAWMRLIPEGHPELLAGDVRRGGSRHVRGHRRRSRRPR